jgi:hypothetical protein
MAVCYGNFGEGMQPYFIRDWTGNSHEVFYYPSENFWIIPGTWTE